MGVRIVKGKDYEKQNMLNSEIGKYGELKVVEYERRKLIKAGFPDLANKVEHVSITVGDGLGYDVLSYDNNGNQIYLEVKTTTTNQQLTFDMTSNELNVMKELGDSYYIVRVFNVDMNKGICSYRYLNGLYVMGRMNLAPKIFRVKIVD